MLIVGNWLKDFSQGVRPFVAALFALTVSCAHAQFSSLSRPEKVWAAFHPFAAMKVRRISHECDRIYDEPGKRAQLDGYAAGGKLDAWRHVFYMAAFAQKVKAKKVARLGKAHEKGNYLQFRKRQLEEGERSDSLSCVMDLRNNELGVAIGCNHRAAPLAALAEITIAAVNQGKAWIFLRDSSGAYLTCDGRPIAIDRYEGRWYVPKCLVRSAGGHRR